MSDEDSIRRTVEAVWRIESSRIVGTLVRLTGDFALAEDVAQEALAEALVIWPRQGVPSEPAGWLITAARRRAIDVFRRHSVREEKYAMLAAAEPDTEELPDPEGIPDDRLALIFTACHPVLAKPARVALTLRVVAGLTTDQIARAYLIPVPTLQARITRAKKTLAAARVPFEVPAGAQRTERLGSVLNVVYLIFTEGARASSGDDLLRVDLAREAIRLGRILMRLVPAPETYGLVALMELTAARFPARTDASGEPVLLADQDRRRWDGGAIRRGRAALTRADELSAAAGDGRGPYALQAAISECHDVARSVAETDWERIVVTYEALGRIAPSSVVDLNRAVAVSMTSGPLTALRIVDELDAADRLAGSHLIPSVRGELLHRLGRTDEARDELSRAIELCGNRAEQRTLRRKVAALTDASESG